jgi:hypothetical protein
MDKFFLVTLIIHITAGATALLSGLGAILFRNELKHHRKFGKVYFWCMNIIFFTAIYLSLAKSNIFLFCVAFFTYYFSLTAFRSLKLKQLHLEQKPLLFDWIIEAFFGIMHLAFTVLAIYLFINKNISFGIISLAFGLLGLRGNYSTIKRLRKKIRYSNYWLIAHISGMLGSYIGVLTAFLVNNNRWIHAPDLLVWLGPAVFLIPLIVFEVNKRKREIKAIPLKK